MSRLREKYVNFNGQVWIRIKGNTSSDEDLLLFSKITISQEVEHDLTPCKQVVHKRDKHNRSD
jgi:hypothetical protein